MKNVLFHTLGCKLNYTESSFIAEQFKGKGFSFNSQEWPDIFIINTCSVTQKAEKECRQIVRRIIRKNPNTFIIVLGCYAQIGSIELAKIDGIDLILGSKEKFSIFDYEKDFVKYDKPIIFVSNFSTNDKAIESYSLSEDRTRAFLKVQDGCDYKCSYCAIPLARGKSKSLNLDTIEKNILHIAEKGFKEIVITGVNVSDYGKKINLTFADLLKQIDKIKEIPRIRISSIEPNNLTEKIIDIIGESERLCHHFHIPLQSGDYEVLKSMRRRYNTKQFKSIIERINKIIPEAGIGFDVIVGFPNENTNSFNNTFSFLNELYFSYLHVFTYSPRPNTPAFTMKNMSTHQEIEKRSQLLRELSNNKKLSFLKSAIGKNYNVLFEKSEKNNMLSGFTENYIRVAAKSERNLINEIIKVSITEAANNYCIGITQSKTNL
jgi:threonylcarbamoyladenosine tRNA methylthiotransferase MtaB